MKMECSGTGQLEGTMREQVETEEDAEEELVQNKQVWLKKKRLFASSEIKLYQTFYCSLFLMFCLDD